MRMEAVEPYPPGGLVGGRYLATIFCQARGQRLNLLCKNYGIQ